MSRAINLLGSRFGALTVLSRQASTNNNVKWLCSCDCGKTHVVYSQNLRNGSTKSCGCLNHKPTHGGSNTRLYQTWQSMRARCTRDSYHASEHYKKRGITVCVEWGNFEAFRSWAQKNGYSDELTLDRKDNNKGYSPENCRFITIQEQQRNKSNHHYLNYKGKRQRLFEWARELGISQSCICNRLSYGWSVERTLSTKPRGIEQ